MPSRDKDVDHTTTSGEFHLTHIGIWRQDQPLVEAAELHEYRSPRAPGGPLFFILAVD